MDAPRTPRKNLVSEQDTPREVELKLEIDPSSLDALLVHPLLAHARPLPDQSGVLSAVYYDTADQALRRAGMTLRVRSNDGRSIQTVKVESGERSLVLDRAEWEATVEGGLDFEAVARTPLATLIADEKSRDLLKPVFSVDTNRRAFLVEHEGALIELAVDQATASAGQHALSSSEVELELKSGQPSSLFHLVRTLAEAAPLRLSLLTKSERGYALTGASAAQPFMAEDIELLPQVSCADAFQVIARSCLTQIVRNEALFRQTRDPNALHQTRVGFRRLKAALSLFKAMLADSESQTVKAELRCAGKQLGAARDLDALIERLRTISTEEGKADLAKAELEHMGAYGDLMEALASPRFMRAVLQTAAWIEAGQWLTRRGRALRQRPIEDHAVEEIARRWAKIRKKLRHLGSLEPEKRHMVRIRIKKLRYITEFLGSRFDGKPARKRRRLWLARFKKLQDVLGELNDIAISATRFPSLAGPTPKQAKRHEKTLLSKGEAAARDLCEAKPFWT